VWFGAACPKSPAAAAAAAALVDIAVHDVWLTCMDGGGQGGLA